MDITAKNEARKLGSNFGKLQSAAVLTGVLYAIVFLLMIPFYINQGFELSSMIGLSVLIVLSALIVHFLLNGLYYMLVVVPLVFAGIFGVLGWLIWITAPMIIGSLMTVISVVDIIDIMDFDSGWIIESFTRIGQTMMFICGALWWFVKKGKDINYAALWIYLIILGMTGVASGFINPSLSYIFLLFWAVISYKIHEHPTVDTNSQLSLVFKIVASLTIIIATMKNVSMASNTWYGEMNYWVVMYSAIVFLAVSFGIWAPGKLGKLLPQNILKFGGNLFNKFKSLLFVRV